MLHTTTRKAMRYGRSFVLTIPHYVAQKLTVGKGDVFVVVFDDEKNVLSYQRLWAGQTGPRVAVDGVNVTSELMP